MRALRTIGSRLGPYPRRSTAAPLATLPTPYAYQSFGATEYTPNVPGNSGQFTSPIVSAQHLPYWNGIGNITNPAGSLAGKTCMHSIGGDSATVQLQGQARVKIGGLDGLGDFTMSGHTRSAFNSIPFWHRAPAGDQRQGIYIAAQSTRLYFSMRDNTGAELGADLVTTTNMADSAWHDWVIRRQGTTVRGWVDGVAGSGFSSAAVTGSINPPANFPWWGCHNESANTVVVNEQAEWCLWHTALSDAQAETIHALRLANTSVQTHVGF